MTRVDVVLPVYNEEHVLERSVRALHLFLEDNLAHEWRILIADNGSTDRTREVGERLASELKNVALLHIPEAGRGRALSRAWLASDADVLSYMDIDLSTDLGAFPKLVSAVAEHGYDIAAGTRLGPGSETTRSLKREVLSRGFVLLINLLFGTRLRDTQCGFKAVSRAAAQRLLPLIRDTGWFWDTELLLLAAKGGWRITFVPVRWVEDPDSRVKIAQTVWRDLRGLARMRRFDWSLARKAGS
ncbi:MAG TPA: dolichyl-phosphate beta-glucosyltransferase [Dehalococcoidia bacterium]|nr:dolichyl-phosphate beta-glucosyltransferase [Dehalococcoidia bacterium]